MQNFRFAIHSIMGHKMRSFLTMFGVIIGVAAVVVIMALGDSMTRSVTEIQNKQANYLTLNYSPTKSKDGSYTQKVTLSDFNDETNNNVDPPQMQVAWLQELMKMKGVDGYYISNSTTATVAYQSKSVKNITVTGSNPSYFDVQEYQILAGRKMTEEDYKRYSSVIVLDEDLAKTLFKSSKEAINKIVSINQFNYRVIGVYRNSEAQRERRLGSNSGYEVLVSNKKLAADFEVEEISSTVVHIKDIKDLQDIGPKVARRLTQVSGVTQGEYQVVDQSAIFEQYQMIFGGMTGVLSAIAAISLLVGGIGVMNIMLVSVTERTREIGLRKALGATRSNILTQFLIESMILTLIGGLIGLLLASGITPLLGMAFRDFFNGNGASISIPVAVMSLAFSAIVGGIFGILPANKASKLDPIESLRYE